MLTAIPDLFRTLIAFAVVLGVLVFVHELGHYLAARWRGVRVETFSIGFGRALTSWTDKHGTVWKLAWLPLGGYVKMHGQERPEDVPDAVRRSWIPGETFQEKSVLSRAIIVAAGPAANFLLAMVVFAGLFLAFGKPIMRPVVGDVLPASAAEQAGLKAHDRIVSIDGKPITTFEALQRVVMANPDHMLPITVQRDGADLSLKITPQAHQAGGRTIGVIGVRGGVVEYARINPVQALWGGVTQTWTVTSDTLVGLKQIVTGTRGTDELGGPLRIAQLSGQVAELGVASLITFIAVLSVNLGLINLFPIPVLDGGHLLFYLAEAIRGRPLPQRALEYGFRAGMALLAGLFVFSTWNDLSHLGLFRWVFGLIG
ncbi:MAG TPA: RIP metalloprotease RseP [Rhodopila sp.]|uniref:RIP metalloprotease RseP n=1 Tax=Rhodopila sp. TaxID=2480087 RepID=UPI002CD5022E|nr:RIP metalloprotease RseP [Rhodopila sp.]HVY18321.1 RIP metalloprotease RseP [Rhodopila sp.]